MSADLVHARVIDHLKRLRLGNVADRLAAALAGAARSAPTYMDVLDQLLRDEMDAKSGGASRLG